MSVLRAETDTTDSFGDAHSVRPVGIVAESVYAYEGRQSCPYCEYCVYDDRLPKCPNCGRR